MMLTPDLIQELNSLNGLSVTSPHLTTLTTTDPRDPAGTMEVQLDFLAVDRMSCAFRELRLVVPSLANASFDLLRDWAAALCQRITYLLENLGPIEFEPDAGQVLIRSTAPTTSAGQRVFYEVLLQTHAGGNFSLKRFESLPGQPGRTPVDLHLTREVLVRLVGDLVETIPV